MAQTTEKDKDSLKKSTSYKIQWIDESDKIEDGK